MHVRHAKWRLIIACQASLHRSSNSIFSTDILCIYAIQYYGGQTSKKINPQLPQSVKFCPRKLRLIWYVWNACMCAAVMYLHVHVHVCIAISLYYSMQCTCMSCTAHKHYFAWTAVYVCVATIQICYNIIIALSPSMQWLAVDMYADHSCLCKLTSMSHSPSSFTHVCIHQQTWSYVLNLDFC